MEINLYAVSGRVGDGAQTGDTPDRDRDALGVVRGIRFAGNRVERLNKVVHGAVLYALADRNDLERGCLATICGAKMS